MTINYNTKSYEIFVNSEIFLDENKIVISGIANVHNGNLLSITNGEIIEHNGIFATFSYYGNGTLMTNYFCSDEHKLELESYITEFITICKDNAKNEINIK